ncbi:MAG: DNA translocase FtsK [Williamsia sp.]|nr:DNA translocase FtsK [Williamsia sp.]
MANKTKSKKSQPNPAILKKEKEESVAVKELVKDERTHKILGTTSILIAVFLFIAFTSYLFTWRDDQAKVFQGPSILFSSHNKANNLLGNLGAYISHEFIFKGFGLASYLFCTFFFTTGVNLMLGKKIFSIFRNLRYIIIGLPFLSVCLAFITKGNEFPWGGAVGEVSSDWLSRLLGPLGAAVLLSAGGLMYIIWRFNPVFSMPRLAKQPVADKVASGELQEEEEELEEEEEVKLFVEQPAPARNGSRKVNSVKEGGAVVVLPPAYDEEKDKPINSFKVVEREQASRQAETEADDEDESFSSPVFTKPVEQAPKKTQVKEHPKLDLEIKRQPLAKEEEEEVTTAGAQAAPVDLYEPTLDLRDYKYPSLDLFETHGSEKIIQDAAELEANKNQILNTLKNYDIAIQKISATVGPTVTLYEIVPAAGVRISRIKNLEDDIALSLAALGIRIIAPIPGKGTIGIEVPNVKKTVVSMKTLLASEKFQNNTFNLPIAIGKKIDNENFIVDLASMPHLLMAGATGQGKSVGLNAILVSLLYKKHPSQLKFVLVDPKKVELSIYRVIEYHFLAKLPGEEESIITDTKKVIHTLNALCIEMDNRYDLLKEAGTRNIKEYNEKFIKRKLNPQKGHQYLPFIVLVIDEFADLIMTAGKEVEMPIARLAQLARAVGIHLIIATQRPSVNIITGTIKANFPARIAFKVSSKIDSRTILDTGGAEQLIGKGDMLISYNGEITRLQCAFVDTPEVEEVTEFIGNQRGYPQAFLLPEYVDEKELEGKDFDPTDRDPLFEEAAKLIVQNQMGSTSLLQRRMKLGYNRAGRLMDQLEAFGVVGPNLGSKARDVLIKTEADLQQHLSDIP